MKQEDLTLNLSPLALDFSQEAIFFRQQLLKRLLGTVGQATTLSNDDLDGLSAAGEFGIPLRRDPTIE